MNSLLLQAVIFFAWWLFGERDPAPQFVVAHLTGHIVGGVSCAVLFWATRSVRARRLALDYLNWAVAAVVAFLPLFVLSSRVREQEMDYVAVLSILLAFGLYWRASFRWVEPDSDV